MALFRVMQKYIALNANNITLASTRAILLTSLAIYSCIPLKAIQYYINIDLLKTIFLKYLFCVCNFLVTLLNLEQLVRVVVRSAHHDQAPHHMRRPRQPQPARALAPGNKTPNHQSRRKRGKVASGESLRFMTCVHINKQLYQATSFKWQTFLNHDLAFVQDMNLLIKYIAFLFS